MTIAIVGAGLGGLALARVLHVNGIDTVVYEREPSRGASPLSCADGGLRRGKAAAQALLSHGALIPPSRVRLRQLFRSQDDGGRRARCVSSGKSGDEVREHQGAEADVDE